MTRLRYLIICSCLLACSPYKKVVRTMSEQQTDHWKGANETAVINTLGAYKSKTLRDDGYVLRFDYSYAKPMSRIGANPSFQVRAATAPTTYGLKDPGTAPRYNPNPAEGRRSAADSVIKYMDFFFTKNGNTVASVSAQGFPDSVYYVKRR